MSLFADKGPKLANLDEIEVTFDVTADTAAALDFEYGRLKEITSPGEAKVVQKCITNLVRLRTGVEAQRKDMKSGVIALGKRIDTAAAVAAEPLKPIETRLIGVKKVWTDEQDRIAREEAELKEKRAAEIRVRIKVAFEDPVIAATSESGADITLRIATMEAFHIDEVEFGEWSQIARDSKAGALDALNELLVDAAERDKVAEVAARERQELDQQREQLARERQEFEAQKADADGDAAPEDAKPDPEPAAATPGDNVGPMQDSYTVAGHVNDSGRRIAGFVFEPVMALTPAEADEWVRSLFKPDVLVNTVTNRSANETQDN